MNEVDLAEGNYKAVASVIHQMTRRDTVQDPETVLNGLKWVAAQPDYTKLPFCYKETGIQVSSWCRFKTMSGQEYMNRNNSKELLLPHSCGPVFSPVSFCNGLFLVVNGDLSDPKSQVVHSTLPASLWEELETDEFFKSLVSV
ncbi:hypothetical protein AGDE_16975 [Angomonas deanei]|nr:hypothetical protein AGDE_16975 [Angomonas deanei]|eukprot:EPY15768.1 hypothetical protein AGDE_16975 [Angomonas deanei]